MTKGQQKRGQLLTAAATLFWVKGYANSSLADIAKSADIPIGNVYYYFKTKRELAYSVATIFVDDTTAMLDSINQNEDDPRKRLMHLLERLSRSNKSRVENGCPINLSAHEFSKNAPKAAHKAHETLFILKNYISQEFQRLGLRPSLANAKAREIIIQWQGGIALAHAMSDITILTEAFRRMENIISKN